LHARRRHARDDEEADDVDKQMALSALDLGAPVEAFFAPDLRRLDALAVGDPERPLFLAPFLLAGTAAEGIEDAFEGPVAALLIVVILDGRPRGEVMRQERHWQPVRFW
jgi:hypothetical protein